MSASVSSSNDISGIEDIIYPDVYSNSFNYNTMWMGSKGTINPVQYGRLCCDQGVYCIEYIVNFFALPDTGGEKPYYRVWKKGSEIDQIQISIFIRIFEYSING